jgi:N-methylhydantoinase B/oxoprolinase/acetone carboxylase alpha subunit
VTMLLQPDSVVRIETSGGGGYGDVEKRDPGARNADAIDGRLGESSD